ncbi:DNA-formamidopyrimidine glycosylase family protein [Conexibacter sp. DBS9H8]|uniref:DNA-formamidopyrimidine glycosylase family protein n=1 Tax=Conexibacter sp. DBS9H8 TaxID=2937801 RepID=UPI00200E6878|nr:DNA-formamidopyrimidine glycosylase family protein [Conexibacter sp. DBS9H8]
MPEGDTILWAATRIRPVLEGTVPDRVEMPPPRPGAARGSAGAPRWPAMLAGRRVESVTTRGKNLFLLFSGGLALHSHLKMTGAWGVYLRGQEWHRAPRRAWLVLEAGGHSVVQFDGPVLELMTTARLRSDRRLGRLGPDLLAPGGFDAERFLARLRAADAGHSLGDSLLDQSLLAGIGNIWKAEGCWEAGLDPRRPIHTVTDAELHTLTERVRPRMLDSGLRGPDRARLEVYGRAGRPCRRCGATIRSAPDGDGARITYWCPGCQRPA